MKVSAGLSRSQKLALQKTMEECASILAPKNQEMVREMLSRIILSHGASQRGAFTALLDEVGSGDTVIAIEVLSSRKNKEHTYQVCVIREVVYYIQHLRSNSRELITAEYVEYCMERLGGLHTVMDMYRESSVLL